MSILFAIERLGYKGVALATAASTVASAVFFYGTLKRPNIRTLTPEWREANKQYREFHNMDPIKNMK